MNTDQQNCYIMRTMLYTYKFMKIFDHFQQADATKADYE